MLEHGGHLLDAAEKYNRPKELWIDLSTGINPNGWPIPEIPVECWQRLPETADNLTAAAKQYYQADSILPVAGSQAAIQVLPLLRPHSKVGVFSPAYAEHAYSWKKANHEIIVLTTETIDAQIQQLDVLIVINPNNPTCERFSKEQLLAWHKILQQHNGWLIIDEAFIDTTAEYSLSSYPATTGLIILRSIGKFFGLAGIRCGFVIASENILTALDEYMGPWTISHPSRYIATAAISDSVWQQSICQQLKVQTKRLNSLLTQYGLNPDGYTDLFQWIKHPQAQQIHQSLAKQGVLTRLFLQPSSLRLGLAKDEQQWLDLEQALKKLP